MPTEISKIINLHIISFLVHAPIIRTIVFLDVIEMGGGEQEELHVWHIPCIGVIRMAGLLCMFLGVRNLFGILSY